LGGNGFEENETEAVADAAGNFYVVGSTGSTDFPVTAGAFQTTLKGGGGPYGGDAWLAKINDDGSLAFATLFGGTRLGWEGFFGPVVDSFGNVYATGRFRSDDCPVTPDAFQSVKGGFGTDNLDAFLAVFNPDGTSLLYGSYIGGSGLDQGRLLAIDPNGGRVVVVGETTSTDLPLFSAPQSTPAGAFMVSFDISPPPTLPGLSAAGRIALVLLFLIALSVAARKPRLLVRVALFPALVLRAASARTGTPASVVRSGIKPVDGKQAGNGFRERGQRPGWR
jgi:hypothetical protein